MYALSGQKQPGNLDEIFLQIYFLNHFELNSVIIKSDNLWNIYNQSVLENVSMRNVDPNLSHNFPLNISEINDSYNTCHGDLSG